MTAVAPIGRAENPVRSIAIAGGLFFIIGFCTWLNGPLITFVRLAFDLNEVNSFLVLMVFYLSYFVLALPASMILRKTGLKRGLSLSLTLMAVGAAMFGEFATRRWYPGALTGLFVLGGGLALLQTAINPYVSILGPIDGAARRIALMGICNKAAGIAAPLVIGALVLRGVGDLTASLQGVSGPGPRGAAERLRGQDPPAIPGHGGDPAGGRRRRPALAASGPEGLRRQRLVDAGRRDRRAQHLQLSAPVAGGRLPVSSTSASR